MTIKPLLDRVVVKAEAAEETTKSGIILTAASQEKPQFATVVAVGPGGMVDDKEVKMYVNIGDKVITRIHYRSSVRYSCSSGIKKKNCGKERIEFGGNLSWQNRSYTARKQERLL